MSKRPTPRSKNDLIQASRHLHYEWTMLNAGATLMHMLADGPARYACLESFLIHARNICLFFFEGGNPWRDDDIVADDFIPEYGNSLGAPPQRLNTDAMIRINREIAHLSYERLLIDRPTKWPIAEMLHDLQALLESFVEKAPQDLLSAEWNSRASGATAADWVTNTCGATTMSTIPATAVNSPAINCSFPS